MKRTTIYFDPDLEVEIKAEVRRTGVPMSELIREAVREYLAKAWPEAPPGAGSFASGRADGADRAEELLEETGFGGDR